ncbi:MAG: hypothetical protein LBB93_01225, partial [Elusimicrobiota bacterium]|nr:hypothetical protein [Elusimicrobiota bacterium]
ITGGFDSRVLLALSIEAGISKNVSYTVIGYEDHPDVIIAKQIAQHFGLNLICKDVVISNLDNKKIEDTFEQSLMQYSNVAGTILCHESWGDIINNFWRQSTQTKDVKKLLMGTSGELFRAYQRQEYFVSSGRSIPNKKIGLPERELLMNERNRQPERWTKKANDYFKKSYDRLFDTFEDLYSNQLTYARTRSVQFHSGLVRKNDNQFCAIGHNSWLHRLSMIQAPEKRLVADIPFRLIENSTPELLYFPFDSKSWKYLAFAHRPDAARFLQIKPVNNVAKRPIPVRSNLVKQARFLVESKIVLDNSVFEVFDEKSFHNILADAKLLISGTKQMLEWKEQEKLAFVVNVYGTSLFMQNKEGNLSAGCPSPVPLSAQSFIAQIKPLYTFNKSWYSEPAEQVLKNGEICFEKQKVFRQSDHNTLNDFEKFIFELDLEHGRLEGELSKANSSLRWERNAKKSITAKFDALSQKTTSSTWLFKQWLNHHKTTLAKSLPLTQK